MKHYLNLSLMGALIFTLVSCGRQESKQEATETPLEEWKQLDAFHMTMAEVFHPLKDSGNLEPATRLMGQLAQEAELLASSPLPAKVNTDSVKVKLQMLKDGASTLAVRIKDGTEEEAIKTQLYAIHDLFHEIQEAWYAKEDQKEPEGESHH